MASFSESSERKKELVLASASKIPEPMQGYVKKAAPVIAMVGAGVEAAVPYLQLAWHRRPWWVSSWKICYV